MRLPDLPIRVILPVLLTAVLTGCASSGGNRSGQRGDSAEAVRLNIQLAQGYMQRGDDETALDRLQRAERLDPRSAEVQTLLGFLYERIRRPEQAERHYRRSVELAPDTGAVLNNYGSWLCRNGQAADSDRWFQRALDDPFYKTPESALVNAGACAVQAGSPERAETYFRRLLELRPDSAEALESLARLNFDKGNYLSARAFWQRREALPVEDPVLLDLAARIETALGNEQGARRYRQRLAAEHPDFAPAAPDSESRP